MVRKLFKSIHSQVLILLLIFIVVPTTIISGFTISESSDSVQENAKFMLETAMEHSKENLTHFMNNAENASLMMITNETIRNSYLNLETAIRVQQRNQVMNVLENYRYELRIHNVRASEIAVINNDKQKIYSGLNTFYIESFTDSNWYKEIEELEGRPYWGSFAVNERHIYVARMVKNYMKTENRFERIGVVLLSFNQKEFSAINAAVNLANNSKIMIIDGDGTILSSTETTLPTQKIPVQLMQQMQEDQPIDITEQFFGDGIDRLTVYDPIPNSSWSIIVTVPIEDILNKQRDIKEVIILTTGVCIIVAFFLAALFAHKLTLPLKRLSNDVRHQIKSSDFAFVPVVPSSKQDEITELGEGFYRLLSDLNSTKNRVHQIELIKSRAEFDAMKSKINPHFLYNSLESIRMLAVVNKDLMTAEMIKSLGHLFRYIISGKKENTTLENELEYLQSYINLQKMRYEDRLQVEIDIPPHLLNLKVEKLMLQPLVENSIEHGIDRKRDAKRIKISASRSEQGILLQVWDNGAGIEPEKLQSIRTHLEDPYNENEHIGLHNVHQRLRLSFGEPYGLILDSKLGEYTSVFVLLPEVHLKINKESREG